MNWFATRPEPDEYVPYYASYIRRVPEGNLPQILERQHTETRALLSSLDDTRALHRYAFGKWSIKEVLGHIADGERVFAYRALWFARGDETPLPGFEENAWVPAGGFDARSLASLVHELGAVRHASVALLSSLDEAAWSARGTANGHPVSVRALAAIMAGHELHHVALLRERYGVGA